MLIENISKESYENICRLIYESDTIYLYGTGNEQKNICKELKKILMLVGKYSIELFDKGEINFKRDNFKKNDLFIIVSLSGESEEGVEILDLLSEKIKTLSITKLKYNPIANRCDYKIHIATREIDLVGDSPYEFVSLFYIFMDIFLYNYINYERSIYEI